MGRLGEIASLWLATTVQAGRADWFIILEGVFAALDGDCDASLAMGWQLAGIASEGIRCLARTVRGGCS